MNILCHVFALSCLALLLCCCVDNINAAPVSKQKSADNRGRYSPQKENTRGRYNKALHDPAYYFAYKSKYPDYYRNRQFYDDFFKKYNPRVSADMARILSQELAVPKADGVYEYTYETENGIHGEERGVPVNIGTDQQHEYVAGTFSYLTPEGLRVTVKYAADEKGYHPIITYDGVHADRYTKQQQPADVVITKVF